MRHDCGDPDCDGEAFLATGMTKTKALDALDVIYRWLAGKLPDVWAGSACDDIHSARGFIQNLPEGDS